MVRTTRFSKGMPEREDDQAQAQFRRIKTILLEEEKEKRRAKSQRGMAEEEELAEPDLGTRQLAAGQLKSVLENNRTDSSMCATESEKDLETDQARDVQQPMTINKRNNFLNVVVQNRKRMSTEQDGEVVIENDQKSIQ